MSAAAITRIPDTSLQCVVRTAYKALVPEGRVGSIVHGGTWIDIGTPAAYIDANLAVLTGRVQAPVDPWTRGRRLATDSWGGADARVGGIVYRSIIGAGAVGPRGAELIECVVWDGVEVPEGRHKRRVFAREGVVVEG